MWAKTARKGGETLTFLFYSGRNSPNKAFVSLPRMFCMLQHTVHRSLFLRCLLLVPECQWVCVCFCFLMLQKVNFKRARRPLFFFPSLALLLLPSFHPSVPFLRHWGEGTAPKHKQGSVTVPFIELRRKQIRGLIGKFDMHSTKPSIEFTFTCVPCQVTSLVFLYCQFSSSNKKKKCLWTCLCVSCEHPGLCQRHVFVWHHGASVAIKTRIKPRFLHPAWRHTGWKWAISFLRLVSCRSQHSEFSVWQAVTTL